MVLEYIIVCLEVSPTYGVSVWISIWKHLSDLRGQCCTKRMFFC
uniref:Uncharacterized protein n=1 Tax=Anopheles minimus TaxID=112268 RepID=A0A182WNG4_9DIPT